MKVAIYVSKDVEDHFIVRTFLSLVKLKSDHSFTFITDIKDLFFDLPLNSEVIVLRSSPKNQMMQRLWWSRQLSNTLKKIKADLFISLNSNKSISLSIPQMLVITDIGKLKIRSIKHFQALIVTNKKAKEILIQEYLFLPDKIRIVYPYPDNIFGLIGSDQREIVKKRYSDGSEFFLYNGNLKKQEDIIHLLKAFSHFKKRQQSGFKLLLTVEPNPDFKKSLESYKYRNDVKLIHPINKEDQEMIVGSAYAVVLPFNNNEDIIVALSSMRSGVPVIAANNSIVKEIADEATTYVDSETPKALGEQLIKLYTNENFRTELLQKGKQVADEFTLERSAGSLWEAVMSALD